MMETLTAKLCIATCENFRMEFERVLKDVPDVETTFFPPFCKQPMTIDYPLAKFLDLCGVESKLTHLVGGLCIRGGDPNLKLPHWCTPHAKPCCFHMLVNPGIVDKLISEGAYVATHGILGTWKAWMKKEGFDQQTAREFFAESTKRIVFLDTGVDPSDAERLRELAEYLDLPAETFPVGLDYLESILQTIIRQWRLTESAKKVSSDLIATNIELSGSAMALDMLPMLARANTEKQAVNNIFEMFSMLFDAQTVEYVSYSNGKPERGWAFPGDEIHTNIPDLLGEIPDGVDWIKTDGGFSIKITHFYKLLGVIRVERVRFPQHIDSYLNTALAVSSVIGLSLKAARMREERESALTALRESREWFQTTLTSIGDGVIATDRESRVMLMNKVAEDITGWDISEAIGKHVSEVFNIVDEATRNAMKNPAIEALETGKVGVLDNNTTLIAKNCAERSIADSGAPIRNHTGDIIGAVLVFRDVTETRLAEAERKNIQQQLFQSQKMEAVGRLAGGIAHEYNNMLAVIMGSAELALSELNENRPVRDEIDIILESAKRSRELSMKLLTFARKEKLESARVPVSELFDAVITMARRGRAKTIRFESKIEGDIHVRVDKNQMQQALLNLANNAADAMPDGGEIRFECREIHIRETKYAGNPNVLPTPYCRIRVVDDGAGIPAAIMEQIFEPFFTTKGIGMGTGLGLSTTLGIVRNHNGFMDVHSEPGRGTAMEIYLPLVDKPEEKEAAAPAVDIVRGSGTILLVDDEPTLLHIGERILKFAGYSILTASSGEAALNIYRENHAAIDLVIMDMIMPGIGGVELFRKMRELNPAARVIIMSGYSVDGDASGLLRDGALDFIQKPYTAAALCRQIHDVLNSAE